MLITAGIRIYLNNGLTEAAIGCESGIITLTEATHAVGTEHLDDHLLEGWDSGCSSVVDIRTHPRPQTFSGGTITIDNNRDYYGKLVMYGAEIEGKKIERVHYRSGDVQVVSTHYIKQVKHETSVIQLSLASLSELQDVEISTPISDNVYNPVIFGSHTYGIYNEDLEQEETNPFSPYENTFLLVEVSKGANSDADITLTPTDNTIPIASLNVDYDTDYYLECVSGVGEGDIISLQEYSAINNTVMQNISTVDGVGAIVKTKDAIYWDTNNDPRYSSMGTDGALFSADTSVFKFFKKTTQYKSDQFASFTATTEEYYNISKQELPKLSYDKSNATITQNDISVVDGDVSGYYWGEFESAEYNTDITTLQYGTYNSYGVWSTNNDGSSSVTVINGAVGDAIDVDFTTYHEVEYSRVSDELINASYSMKVEGDLSDIETILANIECTISNTSITSSGVVVKISAYWVSENGYMTVGEPIEYFSVGYEKTDTDDVQTYTFKNYDRSVNGATSNQYFLDNYYELTTDNVVRGNENYVLNGSGFVVKKSPTGHLVTIRAGAVYTPSGGDTIKYNFKIYGIGYYKNQTGATRDNIIYSPVTGRPYTTFSAAIEHIIKLRNWNSSGVTQPSAGWGLGEASVTVTDNASNTTAVRSQFKEAGEITTTAMEQRLSWESWSIINFNKDDTPYINTAVDKLGTETATHSFTEPDDCEQGPIEVFDEQDVFNVFNIQYDYDAPTGTYNSSISIVSSGKDTFDTSYVSGISTATIAEELWDDCHTLYGVTGAEKKLPESRSQLRWIYTEADAIEYIRACLKWYGIVRLSGSSYGAYFTTRRVTMEHDIRDYYTVNIGDSIEYTIPNITNGTPFSGVVVGMGYNPDSKKCTITSVLRAQIINRSIIETGSADKSIVEQGNSIDTIIEVGV